MSKSSKEAGINFAAWAGKLGERQKGNRNLTKQAQEHQKAQEIADRLAAKEAERQKKEDEEKWKKRKNEDEKILKNGALGVFKEAANIMKHNIRFDRSEQPPTAEIIKPEKDEEPIETHVRLIWGKITDTPAGNSQPGCHRKSNGVTCFVARDESGIPLGYRLNDSTEVIPFEKDNASLNLFVFKAVQKTHTENLTTSWFDFR